MFVPLDTGSERPKLKVPAEVGFTITCSPLNNKEKDGSSMLQKGHRLVPGRRYVWFLLSKLLVLCKWPWRLLGASHENVPEEDNQHTS